MSEKIEPNDIVDSLQKANKYIFVQDYEKAEKTLLGLCQNGAEDYEVYFRRIEVAIKGGKIEALIQDFLDQKQLNPNSDIINLSLLLAKLKKYTLIKKTIEPRRYNHQISLDNMSENFKILRLPNKKIKLHRNLSFPDDMIQNSQNKSIEIRKHFDDNYFDEIFESIFKFSNDHPENYAAQFIAGCAFENIGNLDEAVYKWKKSLSLCPDSICALSVLSELQLRGYFSDVKCDYCIRLENIDRYLVHGHIETHTDLYNEFIKLGDYKNAISSLRILYDWISRQYGTIPIEIKVVCLLGIMNAYKLDGNIIGEESSRNEVENIVIGYKKSNFETNNLVLIAELCEEYELKILAKICYYTILTTSDIDLEILKKVATHCVTHYASEALLLNLKIAYENSKGNSDLRFCIILCALNLKNIDVICYMDIKNKIRDFISENQTEEAFPFLNDLSEKFNDDPEIHYYLAEIYSRKKLILNAKKHFELMYNLDFYNPDAIIKYIYFLLKNKFYDSAVEVCHKSIALGNQSISQTNEINWALSVVYFSQEQFELSSEKILKSLTLDPWNISYISLLLRCSLHLSEQLNCSESFEIVTNVEEFIINNNMYNIEKKDKLVHNLIQICLLSLKKNHFEIAWSFAKCALIINKKMSDLISEVLSKTAATFNFKTAVPELLALLKSQNEMEISFFEISQCIAKIYGLTGQWKLVDEWLSMTQNQPYLNKMSQSKLFELEALSIAMQGADLKKAQNLLEAAIDCYDNNEKVPLETQILHGYILVSQGNIALGIEKMQSGMNENTSIQSLYFFVKGLDRAGKLSSISKESIDQMRKFYPSTDFEQKMVEEIFYTVSSQMDVVPLGLAC